MRGAVAWDLSAAIYLVLAFRVMLTCKGEALRARAARQDDSRMVILVIILLAITASFVAIAGLLAAAKAAPTRPSTSGSPRPPLCFHGRSPRWSSRCTTPTSIIAPRRSAGALPRGSISEESETRTIGTSSISRPPSARPRDLRRLDPNQALRRLATLHAIISFFFNTAALALTINLAASLI